MSALAELRQQILDNFYFHALLESDLYIIAKISAGDYQADVMEKSENQVNSLTGEVAATAEEALRKLFDKSCERVQGALDDLSVESGSASDANA